MLLRHAGRQAGTDAGFLDAAAAGILAARTMWGSVCGGKKIWGQGDVDRDESCFFFMV